MHELSLVLKLLEISHKPSSYFPKSLGSNFNSDSSKKHGICARAFYCKSFILNSFGF